MMARKYAKDMVMSPPGIRAHKIAMEASACVSDRELRVVAYTGRWSDEQ